MPLIVLDTGYSNSKWFTYSILFHIHKKREFLILKIFSHLTEITNSVLSASVWRKINEPFRLEQKLNESVEMILQ